MWYGKPQRWLTPLLAVLLSACTTPFNIGGVSPAQGLPSLAPMIHRVAPAVVNIASQGRVRLRHNPLLNDPYFRRFFGLPEDQQEGRTESLGSGVIINAAKGYIVTNQHVVAQADHISVTLQDGRRFQATLVGADPETDIAVIRIPAHHLTALRLANSDHLRVGDFVVAIGNPYGLGQSVTAGIVSALGRSGLGIEGYEDFIQTDASINPGSSGGALVNLRGELVGLNTAILAPNGGSVGINFAIPSNMVRRLVAQLIRYGKLDRGQLGVVVTTLEPEQAAKLGATGVHGALITRIQRASPAAAAGLRPDDIIVAVQGQSIRDASGLRNAIGLLRVGQTVKLNIIRAGQPLQVTARIGRRPPTPRAP